VTACTSPEFQPMGIRTTRLPFCFSSSVSFEAGLIKPSK